MAAKAAQRRGLSGLAKSVSFSDLASDPRYQRIATAICPDDLSGEITALGLQTAAEVAAFRSVSTLETRLAPAIKREQFSTDSLRQVLSRSKREALRGHRMMRHAIAMQEPMSQALRHSDPRRAISADLLPDTADVQAYAKPSSLQSDQSLGAYLRHLFRIATGLDQEIGIITEESSPFAIANRRPDLAALTLTESNLKKEVPTLDLVNEVLSAGLGDIDMGARFFPIALPYDHATTTARTALAQVGGMQINDIATRTTRLGVERFRDHRWARDTAGLLGVLGASESAAQKSVLELISEDAPKGPETLEGLYNAQSRKVASKVEHLTSSLDLDFDGLAQILGLYTVSQESGEPVDQKAFATAFLANAHPIEMTEADGDRSVRIADADLSAPVLRSLNYLARLHHATGLDFHDLNTILSLPGAADSVVAEADDPLKPARRVTATGLRLLATHTLYRDAFRLSAPAFGALFGEISPYWRADQIIEDDAAVTGLEQTETSLLRSLFGDKAPYVHRTVSAGETSIADGELANTIARGLGLNALELARLVSVLDDPFALTSGVDARGLGAIYRLSTLFQMLGWSVLSGLDLVGMLSDGLGDETSLLTALIARNMTENETETLCSALDWLVGLAQWMAEAELAPDAMIALLASARTEPSEDDLAWFGGLATAFAPDAAGVEIFRGFVTWSGSGQEIPAETWHQHLLGIYRPTGVFTTDIDRSDIEAACRACLIAEGVDPDQADNAAQLQNLVEHLVGLRDRQLTLIAAQIAALDPKVSVLSAASLMTWAQTTALDLLDALLQGPGDPSGPFWLSEIRRHIAVVTTLQLGDVDLWLLAHRPQWIAPGIAGGAFGVKPFDLAQLIWLQRFATIQVGAATDAAWRGYLALTNEGKPGTEASSDARTQWTDGCRDTLALLIGCPAEDAAIYLDALFGAGSVAETIAQIDSLAAHARLADELGVSARDLMALKAVSASKQSGDWEAAAAAAQSGLSRFDDGRQVPGFRKLLAEHHRDALVAAFMQTKISSDDALLAEVTDREKLYTYLLLDVNVTSAVPTSRLVEATHSLQLYISRVLAGLEPQATLTADGFDRRPALAAQWEIDKDYRQWEANQKLQLYPQNYIEPELRQITSPEFDTLLQSVSGGDVSPDGVETAVNAYMNGLAGMCDLSLCSLNVERHPGSEGTENATYHVLAKAKWEPGRFFYRKLDADYQVIAGLEDASQFLKAMDWTYWREVSIPKTFDLFSDVTVCVFKNRYYFFWLELEERRNQTADGPVPSWRLHPRYMRCDQNALTGPMLTPGMFIKGEIGIKDTDGKAETLHIDGALEWSGARPVLNGIYHPTRAPDGLVYGVLNSSDSGKGMASETLAVAFGVDLPAKGDGAGTQRTALHIRLSDEWSDAIIDLDGALLTLFDDNAPSGYDSIHPLPVSERRGVVDHNFKEDPSGFNELTGFYTRQPFPMFNMSRHNTGRWQMSFFSSGIGDQSLGSVEIDLRLADRYYVLNGSTAQALVEARETSPSLVMTRCRLEFVTANQHVQKLTTDWVTRSLPEFSFAGQVTSREEVDHPTNEVYTTRLVLPDHWAIGDAGAADLTVRFDIKRVFPEIERTFVEHSNPTPQTEVIAPDSDGGTIGLKFGTFKLRKPTGQDDSGWAQTGEHGTRNFLHLTEQPGNRLEETFVIANSSSVLSKLAKSMPRPGGCESLFALESHLDREEDFGTFLQDYPATLVELYQDDQTTLDPDRLPKRVFDFNSAYGAYGWEVFYDIPSAIAAGYASSGQYELALRWLRKIFDPQLENPWQVSPLMEATDPRGNLAFDTGDVIIDPDRIARDYPFYYQQATIRNYLEVLLEAGDAAYEQQTQESLQRAKALYVSAMQLFSDNLSDTLEAVTNTPWTDPTLSDVAADGYEGFLPPLNDELRGLYGTLEVRLDNLRQWLDLNGEPLEVPLLAPPIDPRQLQRTAKARLALGGASDDAGDEAASPLDFSYVVASVKGYLNNLKLTSHRLQDASEKESDSEMEEFRMDANISKTRRAIGLQNFAIEAAERDVAIKSLNVVASTTALTNHVAQTLIKQFEASSDLLKAAKSQLQQSTILIGAVSAQISATLKSTMPNTFGFSNGGQNLEQADVVWSILKISHFLYSWDAGVKRKQARTSAAEWTALAADTAMLATKLSADGVELDKATIVLDREKAEREERKTLHRGAQDLRKKWNTVFGGTSFYNPFREDLEVLFADEWSATQELCRLLVRLYQEETQRSDGASFLRTTSLGSGVQSFSAPHRLALDVERLETAYIQALVDQIGDMGEVQFALGEIPAQGQGCSALEELVTQGETYFDVTDDMFDLYYPGQYDRRIQSIAVSFPGLARAGLNPHARLTQVSNTRYLSSERDRACGSRIRKDRYGLQSLMLSSCEVDTRSLEAPEGLLRPFQNTGVGSRWHLSIPAIRELKRGKAGRGADRCWREAAAARAARVQEHLNGIDLTVRFSGRWD